MSITIYHNPSCGTSRNTLALIRNSGVEPEVVEYLKTPPTKATLQSLIDAMGISPCELLREKGTPYTELDLANAKWTDDQLVEFMLAHPILINRPVVVTPLGTRLCRPSEAVLGILPNPQQAAFTKEDGEKVIDEKGILGRWMRMITIPNQISVAKAFQEFDDVGRMKPSAFYDRVVDVMEELVKFTLLTRDVSPYLVSRYSERKETAADLSKRVNQRAI